MAWTQVADLSGAPGAPGAPGADGVSVTGAAIDASGDLIVTLSSGGTINAGQAKGDPGGGIDFESSVPTVADLPASAPYGEARYVQADGHLYVFEADGGGPGVDGWTDVGAIRGETGAAGAAGTDGVSVTGATVNGSGDLVISLSSGSPITAGHVVGAQGAPGSDGSTGATGPRGSGWFTGSGAPGTLPGQIAGDLYLDTATGVVYKLA